MKYIIASLILAPFLVFAQTQAALPRAGFVPGSPFYFLDRLGEAIQEFITFNPEAKARLQITFAAERIAEIQLVFETKGVEAKGLDVAKSRLRAHLAKTASIVSIEKSKGKDVSTLAKELDSKFEGPKSALALTFKEQKRALEAKEEDIKAQLRAAHRAGDTAQEEAIASQLGQVKAQKELLELKEEDIDDDLEAEEEKLAEEMEAQHKAEKAIREAEEEKQEVIDEAAEENVALPADVFVPFDDLLSRAKSEFQAGNFAEARSLAKQAKNSLKSIEKIIKDLEKTQELKEEVEEAIEEAEEEKQEVINEAQKEGVDIPTDAFVKFDRLLLQAKELLDKGNYQGAKQLAEQAEKSLEEVEKTLEKLKEAKEREGEKTERERERVQEKAETGEKVSEQKPAEKLRKEFKVSGQEFSFSPSSISVKAGTKVKIQFENHGSISHNLIVEGLGIGTKTISPDDDASFEFVAPSSGTYTFYCSVGNHKQLGMEGKLIVE